MTVEIKKEFMTERQGKPFVLYAGLLDAAHRAGLVSIKTELIQVPNEMNGQTAICGATVTMEKDGVLRTFTGIGDAAPNNVSAAMRTCLIRMAETRSKARAIRDAINVGTCSVEELGDDAASAAPEASHQAPRRPTSTNPLRMQAGTPGMVPKGQQCPSCHAPGGKAHTKGCKATSVAI